MDGSWSKRAWFGLASAPHLMFLRRFPSLSRTFYTGSVLSLSWLLVLRRIINPASAPLSLLQRRFALLCGTICVGRLYDSIYQFVLFPWFIGTRSLSAATAMEERNQPAAAVNNAQGQVIAQEGEEDAIPDFAEFELFPEDTGIRADGNQIRISLLDLFRWYVETLLTPSISLATGRVIRAGCALLLSRLRPDSLLSAVLSQAVQMDQFNWCLVGSCGWVLARDSARLLYGRFRKQQRMRIHIMDRPQ
jgi:hypothetical protein